MTGPELSQPGNNVNIRATLLTKKEMKIVAFIMIRVKIAVQR